MTLPPCADYSRQLHEPLYGIISQADAYFMLEYPAPFGQKALPESTLNPAIFQHLASVPRSNCVLIRQPLASTDTDGKITFFAANTQTHKLYELSLESADDLFNIDIAALLAGDVIAPRTEPLLLICANGKRDICCSTYGVAFYNAIKPMLGENVWQCSHIGGHRFAATGITFPMAVAYGYLDPEHAPMLVDHISNGTVWLDKLRGDLRYSEVLQAADYFLRQQLNEIRHDALTLITTVQSERDWQVAFEHNGELVYITVEEGELLEVLAGTGDTFFKQTHPYRFINTQEFNP